MQHAIKTWYLLNYEYIQKNIVGLSKEVRLLLSSTNNVKYKGHIKVAEGEKEHSFPALEIDHMELLNEIRNSGFVEKHSIRTEVDCSNPLFVYFAIGQILFDKMYDVLATQKKEENFSKLQKRCMQRFLKLYVETFFDRADVALNEAEQWIIQFRAIPAFPLFNNDFNAPDVVVILDPKGKEPRIISNLNSEIAFDLKILSLGKGIPDVCMIH